MCVLIDINSLSHVFNPSDSLYSEYSPVKDWIDSGRGKLVFGGSEYLDELSKTKYRRVILEYKRQGKAISFSTKEIDDVSGYVSGLIVHRDFDDPHIIAIVKVSKCCVVCTTDDRAVPYIKNNISGIDFYSGTRSRPGIYKNKKFGEPMLTRVQRTCGNK